jgi:hypothetical protein
LFRYSPKILGRVNLCQQRVLLMDAHLECG